MSQASHSAFCLHFLISSLPQLLSLRLKWLPFPSEKTGVERDQHLIQVIQLGRGNDRIEPSQSHSSLVPFYLLTGFFIFATPSCTRETLPSTGLQSSAPGSWSPGSFSHVLFSPVRLQHSESGHVCFSAWSSWAVVAVKSWNAVLAHAGLGVLFSVGTCIIIIVIEHLIIGCAPLMALPALCSHRFDFIYDLFEHVSSRNKQDTLKCGSKHRPTVSSQFKVSLCCWPGWTHTSLLWL